MRTPLRVFALLLCLECFVSPLGAQDTVGLLSGCTGVVIAGDGQVIVGGNEDWLRDDSYLWATAATATRHGVVYLGYQIRGEWGARPAFWYEFHGINDAGLYFDSFGVPCVTPEAAGKRNVGEHIMVPAMEQCSTVAEAVELFQSFDLRTMSCQQYLFVDRTGGAAVVEAAYVTWRQAAQRYLVVTNFRFSDPSLGGYPCPRYRGASSMLDSDSTATVDRVKDVLRRVSHAGTRYTVVADLPSGRARVYYRRDFDRPVLLDIAALCRSGSPRVALSALVPRLPPSPD